MAEPELNDDFRDLLRALTGERVHFVVVGAHALAAHGIVRATGDLDVLVRPTVTNAARLLRALTTFGAPVAAHHIRKNDFAREGNVYQIGLPPRRIDILTSISGVTFGQAYRSRLVVEVDGLQVPVLGRAMLLENKRASGRPKDRLDVAALEATDPPRRARRASPTRRR